MAQYQVVEADSLEELHLRVNALVREGFVPQGNLIVRLIHTLVAGYPATARYWQALWKED